MHQISRCKPLLGTYVEVHLSSSTASESDLMHLSQTAFSRIESVQKLMSFHDAESDISRINRKAYEQKITVAEDTRTVLELSLNLSRQSMGVFDISVAPLLIEQGLLPELKCHTDSRGNWKDIILDGNKVYFNRPMILDVGGIAKGYAVDKACESIIREANSQDVDFVINAGGDLRMSTWQGQTLRISTPFNQKKFSEIAMKNCAVATSGDYLLEGKLAIISKNIDIAQDRQNSDRPLSVSVFSEHCVFSDALTKCVFLSKNPIELLKLYDAKAFVIYSDKSSRWLN